MKGITPATEKQQGAYPFVLFNSSYDDVVREINTMANGYRKNFSEKKVYCHGIKEENNFWDYFVDRFDFLNIRELYTISIENGKNYAVSYDGLQVKKELITGEGDALYNQYKKFVEKADIVVSDSPFCRFKEFIDFLIESKKQFIVSGSTNFIEDIFDRIKGNEVWFGHTNPSSFEAKSRTIISKRKIPTNWYTNIMAATEQKSVSTLSRYYGYEVRYPKFDNYDAIYVKSIYEIPGDYDGVMGVPAEYLEHHNGKQFDIVGIAYPGSYEKWGKITGEKVSFTFSKKTGRTGLCKLSGKWLPSSKTIIFIQKKEGAKNEQ